MIDSSETAAEDTQWTPDATQPASKPPASESANGSPARNSGKRGRGAANETPTETPEPTKAPVLDRHWGRPVGWISVLTDRGADIWFVPSGGAWRPRGWAATARRALRNGAASVH